MSRPSARPVFGVSCAVLLALSSAPAGAAPTAQPAPAIANAAEAPVVRGAMSFADALELRRSRSDLLRAHDAEVAHAQHQSDAAKFLGGPKVDIAAMQVEGTKTVELGLDTPNITLPVGIGGQLTPITIPAMNLNFSEKIDIGGPRAMLNFNWPLYTGGAVSAKQEALRRKVDETAYARDAEREKIDAGLAMAYWGVQLAREVERLHAGMLADEEAEVKRAQAFEAKGVISKLERMSVEVSRDAAKRAWISAQTEREAAETQLRNALREDALPELSTPLFILEGDLGTLDDWTARAMLASPVLAQIDAQTAQAEAGVQGAKSLYHPKVFAFGTKNLVKHYLTLPEPDWIAGIGVTFTLWSNQDRASSVAAATSVVDKARAARNEARTEIRTAVETAFLRVNDARESYRLTAGTLALAEENLRLRRAGFAEGLSTAIDLSNARTQLTAAQIALRAAAYKFVAAWATLHAVSGEMPRFLESLNRSDLVAVPSSTGVSLK